MAEVPSIDVADFDNVRREVPTILSLETLLTALLAFSYGDGTLDAGTLRTTIASNGPLMALLGAINATVPTDPTATNLTHAQMLRGIFSLTKAINDRDATAAADPSALFTQDGGTWWTTKFGLGSPLARFTSADASTAAAVTDAPTAGQKIVVDDAFISAAVAMEVSLQEETSATVKWSGFLPANGTIQLTPRSKWKLDTADKKLMIKGSIAGNLRATIGYHSEA